MDVIKTARDILGFCLVLAVAYLLIGTGKPNYSLIVGIFVGLLVIEVTKRVLDKKKPVDTT